MSAWRQPGNRNPRASLLPRAGALARPLSPGAHLGVKDAPAAVGRGQRLQLLRVLAALRHERLAGAAGLLIQQLDAPGLLPAPHLCESTM